MSRRTRILLSVTIALVAWFALTLRWAAQPMSDAVPVGKDAAGIVVVENVTCGSTFESSAMGGNQVPTIVTPDGIKPAWELSRDPCTLVHDQSRVLLGINVGVFLLGIAAIGFVGSRTRQPPIPQMTAA